VKITKGWRNARVGSSALPHHMLDVDHGVRDRYDRRVGGQAVIVDHGASHPQHKQFEVYVIGTRDSAAFGKMRRVAGELVYFNSIDAAKHEAEERLKRQGASARKAHGGRS